MDYVPEDTIEQIIGRPRDKRYHWGLAEIKNEKITIMHSARCLDMHKRGIRDMFDCSYSMALDIYGIGYMPVGEPMILTIKGGRLAKRELIDTDEDWIDMSCAWSDYRKDYGVSEANMDAAHKAFKAGWKAAKEGPQDGVLR